MNFVFVSYDYDPNFDSPEQWLNRVKIYTGVLECLGQKHSVARIQQVNYKTYQEHNGVKYHFVNYSDRKSHFPWKLNRFIRSLKPDIVFVHGLHNPLQVIQLRLQLNRKTGIIAQNHAEKPATGIRRELQIIADNYIDAYMFASREMGVDWVRKGNLASADKIREVMEVSSVFYPVDRDVALAKTGITGQPVFLWVGRLNDNKDPLNVVKAFLRFVKIQPLARLYMIYHTGELLNEIKALLNEPDAPLNAITLVGKVPHDDLLYWYNSADFIISGSHYEGSGTAVCEAMSCGCIPVVTDIFSFRAMTDNGACGILYEPGNMGELLSALMQTQKLDKNLKREQAIAFFKANLSFEAIAQRMEQIALWVHQIKS
jgi:glycosyltransferase involved in cell wall biosynthesis